MNLPTTAWHHLLLSLEIDDKKFDTTSASWRERALPEQVTIYY